MNAIQTYLTPKKIADRWSWHVESVRRKIRRREIASTVIGRRRLVSIQEIERIEREGAIPIAPRC